MKTRIGGSSNKQKCCVITLTVLSVFVLIGIVIQQYPTLQQYQMISSFHQEEEEEEATSNKQQATSNKQQQQQQQQLQLQKKNDDDAFELVVVQPSDNDYSRQQESTTMVSSNNSNSSNNNAQIFNNKSRMIVPTNNNTTTFVPVEKNDIIMKGGTNHAPVVIEKYKLIFFPIQKCGGTVWKQLFRRILGHDDWRTGITWGNHAGLNLLNNYTLQEATQMMNDPTWIKAIMVRDPKERMLSAYLDKAVKTKKFYTVCCSKTKQKQRKREWECPENNNNNNKEYSFEDFITITDQCYDTHWSPQSHRMEPKYTKLLNFVGHLETAYQDAKELLTYLGAWDEYGSNGWGKFGNESIFQSTSFVLHKTAESNIGSNSRLTMYYNTDLERIVEQRFKCDYDTPQFDLPLTEIKY